MGRPLLIAIRQSGYLGVWAIDTFLEIHGEDRVHSLRYFKEIGTNCKVDLMQVLIGKGKRFLSIR